MKATAMLPGAALVAFAAVAHSAGTPVAGDSQSKVSESIGGAVQTHKDKNHRCVISPTLMSAGSGLPPDRTPPAQISGDFAVEKGDGCPSEQNKRALVTQPGR